MADGVRRRSRLSARYRLGPNDFGEAEVLPCLGDFDGDTVTNVRVGDEDDEARANTSDTISLLALILDFDLELLAFGDRGSRRRSLISLAAGGRVGRRFARLIRSWEQSDLIGIAGGYRAQFDFTSGELDDGGPVVVIDLRGKDRQESIVELHRNEVREAGLSPIGLSMSVMRIRCDSLSCLTNLNGRAKHDGLIQLKRWANPSANQLVWMNALFAARRDRLTRWLPQPAC